MSKIFIDMDGVLVDFEKGFKDKFGISVNDAHAEGKLWTYINSSNAMSFWSNLPPMPDYMKLWDYVKSEDVTILTGCPHARDKDGNQTKSIDRFARYGKFYWLVDNLGKSVLQKNVKYEPVFSEDKWKYAKPGFILIDDRADLCEEWEEKCPGVIAICHKNARDTIRELDKIRETRP